MDLLTEFFADESFIFVVIVSAAGGLFGGLAAGRGSSAPLATVIGAVFGTITSIIVGGMNLPTLVEVGGFPLVWAAAGGALSAYAISRTSGS